jgi:hypothetical protein
MREAQPYQTERNCGARVSAAGGGERGGLAVFIVRVGSWPGGGDCWGGGVGCQLVWIEGLSLRTFFDARFRPKFGLGLGLPKLRKFTLREHSMAGSV